ncbi:IpaD/SipD/SspD family type III secretion system needle tip protein [Providencia rettgeri]|uniref:IpaD/SipD/SspD family type III secretion system needle tip protein n=1 Tax=Providencia rettgeri TaxID=587 RepID=UPI0034E0AF3D
MEIVSQRNYANTIPVNMTGKTIEGHRSQVSENIHTDILVDPYEQSIQFAKDLGLSFSPTTFREDAVTSNLDKIKAQMQAAKRDLNYTNDLVNGLRTKRSTTKINHVDGRPHIEGTKKLIENIHTGYQKQYGEIIKKATEYMQDVNTALGKMSQHIEPGKDGKVQYNKRNFLDGLNRSFEKYSTYCAGRNYNQNDKHIINSFYGGWSPSEQSTKPIASLEYNKSALQFWEKKLGRQGFFVKRDGNTINIYPDLKPISEIFSASAAIDTEWWGGDIMAQQFQSLQTAIDSQKNTVNNSVSRLLENFRQDNSHFETLVQLLIQLIKDLNQNNNSLVNM